MRGDESLSGAIQFTINRIMQEAVQAAVIEAQEKVRHRIIDAVALWTAKATAETNMTYDKHEVILRIKLDPMLLETRDKQAIMKAIFG